MRRHPVLLVLGLVMLISTLACSSDADQSGLPLEGEVTDLAGEFIALMVEQDYRSAVSFFNADMRKAMPERKLRQTWQAVLAQQGSYVGEVETSVQPVGDYEAVNVITEFSGGRLNIRVVFDGDNRVAGLWFLPAES